jgi:hypothetical protein
MSGVDRWGLEGTPSESRRPRYHPPTPDGHRVLVRQGRLRAPAVSTIERLHNFKVAGFFHTDYVRWIRSTKPERSQDAGFSFPTDFRVWETRKHLN